MRFLVVGGAGYIGSHFVREAMRQGHSCVVYDSLSRGHRASVPNSVPLVQADLLDQTVLEKTLSEHSFDAVFHFAALALVGESVVDPDLYYSNNCEGVRRLLCAMRLKASQAVLVFSSSCAVYGVPEKLPLMELEPKKPISPYGRSKLVAEWMIEDACRAYGIRAMALRYFNACGADPSGDIGEDHQPETHLLPNVIAAAFRDETVTIFGESFPTRDGTCIRDYIHVIDLADAHIKAADFLSKQPEGCFEAANLGTGQGYSNLEIVAAVGKSLGKTLAFQYGEPRPGDPAELYADNTKAKKLFAFECRYSDLSNIIETAIRWHRSHPHGYAD